MAIGYLNERTRKIIIMILKGSSIITIKDMAAAFSVSTRTIYNELDKANSWLGMKKLPLIQVNRGKVQLFSAEEKAMMDKVLELQEPKDDYIFTPTERTQIIVCCMILSKTPVYVEELMNACQVSRNTIFTDLQAVISQLHSYQLEIAYEKKRGYFISGDPIRVRAVFFLYFSRLEQLFSSGRLNFIYMDEITPYLQRIEAFEKEQKVKYVRNDMIALAAMIPVMERGEDQLVFPDVDIQKVKETKEYQLVGQYFSKLSEREMIYLTLHFLGGRLASVSKGNEGEEDESVLEMAKNLVQEFERRAFVLFERKDELVRSLYQHIKASIYRYRFGIQIGNLMEVDIQREYPYIFEIVRACVVYLEQQIGVQISDSEVSYLALHFGSHLEYARHDEKELRILVVCVNGMATGNMISHELERILPQAKIVGVTAASKMINPQEVCDLIISSVKINAVVPVIVVNPILNDFDRKNILNHPLVRGKYGFVDVEALLQLLKKYVKAEELSALRHELILFLSKAGEEKQPVLNPEMWRLTDFLTDDRIIFLDESGNNMREKNEALNEKTTLTVGHIDEEGIYHVDETDELLTPWEKSIYSVAEPLIRRGSIKEEYVEKIIGRMMKYGPYMFVTKDLILAHANPKDGVKHLDIAIGIAPKGIAYPSGQRARIVFCMAPEDQQKHMGVLRDIRKSMAKPTQVDGIVEKTTAAEVMEFIQARLEENS